MGKAEKDKRVQFVCTLPDAKIPHKQTSRSACYDLYAPSKVNIRPGETTAVNLGIISDFAEGWYGKIHNRSGLCCVHEVYMPAGTLIVDNERANSELRINLHNGGKQTYTVSRWDRIAQFELCRQAERKTRTRSQQTCATRKKGKVRDISGGKTPQDLPTTSL